jgi:NitT/TauT family transport system substrate-binding protein
MLKSNWTIIRVVLFTLAASVLLSGCNSNPPAADQAAGGKPELTPISFVSDWKAQAEHGGFYEALAEGLYEKAGLKVSITQGGPGVNVPQLIAGGAADFGMGSNGFIPLNMLKAGVKVKAVMAVFQKDPQVLITHPRDDIKGLADMKGKPIMISDAATTAFWPWLKAKYGFSDSQIRRYTFNAAPFIVDPKAIQEGYLSSEPYTIEQEGHFKPRYSCWPIMVIPVLPTWCWYPRNGSIPIPKPCRLLSTRRFRDGWITSMAIPRRQTV